MRVAVHIVIWFSQHAYIGFLSLTRAICLSLVPSGPKRVSIRTNRLNKQTNKYIFSQEKSESDFKCLALRGNTTLFILAWVFLCVWCLVTDYSLCFWCHHMCIDGWGRVQCIFFCRPRRMQVKLSLVFKFRYAVNKDINRPMLLIHELLNSLTFPFIIHLSWSLRSLVWTLLAMCPI